MQFSLRLMEGKTIGNTKADNGTPRHCTAMMSSRSSSAERETCSQDQTAEMLYAIVN